MGREESATGQRVSRRGFAAAFSAAVASAAVAPARAAGVLTDSRQAEPLGQANAVDEFARCVDRGIEFLRSQGQTENGAFSPQTGVGVTTLATVALLRHGRGVDDPLVARSLGNVVTFVQPDGGIYSPGGMLANYETCLAMMCLQHANADQRYTSLLRRAESFVRGYQWGETTGKDRSDVSYGGAGYGKHQRPDLSNTAFLIDALKTCGRGADDPAIQKALVFVSRCQNLESEHNTTPFASMNPDGGFYYTCAAGGSSAAGTTATGGLRSYASMTYSGLKTMLYAGLGPDDPRVRAATAWIRSNYDLTSNPGLGSAGLYYYYHVFAKTLHALGGWSFEDSTGVSHDWRSELAGELRRCQRQNGSWVNEDDRWMEGDPNLVTAYALLALSYCRPQA